MLLLVAMGDAAGLQCRDGGRASGGPLPICAGLGKRGQLRVRATGSRAAVGCAGSKPLNAVLG